MQEELYEIVSASPIIPAIKDKKGLKKCIESDIKMVFVLYGDICSISNIVDQLKNAGKTVMVHADLIEGLNSQDVAADFIKQYTRADGIISTRINVINRACELSLYTIYRVFVIDSRAVNGLLRQADSLQADLVEILPGSMPKVTKSLTEKLKIPLIAGGLIRDKEDVMQALEAGAMCISSTNQDVWFM